MFLVALVCLFVCLFVDNITPKRYEWIGMECYGAPDYDSEKLIIVQQLYQGTFHPPQDPPRLVPKCAPGCQF